MQSIPSRGLFSLVCLAFTVASDSTAGKPLFSAKARGIDSKASAKARTAYCSSVEILYVSIYQYKVNKKCVLLYLQRLKLQENKQFQQNHLQK